MYLTIVITLEIALWGFEFEDKVNHDMRLLICAQEIAVLKKCVKERHFR